MIWPHETNLHEAYIYIFYSLRLELNLLRGTDFHFPSRSSVFVFFLFFLSGPCVVPEVVKCFHWSLNRCFPHPKLNFSPCPVSFGSRSKGINTVNERSFGPREQNANQCRHPDLIEYWGEKKKKIWSGKCLRKLSDYMSSCLQLYSSHMFDLGWLTCLCQCKISTWGGTD